jgi:hypothetical protein
MVLPATEDGIYQAPALQESSAAFCKERLHQRTHEPFEHEDEDDRICSRRRRTDY